MTVENEVGVEGITGVLAAGISPTDSSFTLDSTVDAGTFPTTSFQVKIGNEVILVGSRSGASFSSLTRAQERTNAVPHARGDGVVLIVGGEVISSGGGGGGSQPTNSFYVAALADVDAAGTATWNATTITTEGPQGFTLNADTETFNCTTTGIYVIYLEPGILGTSAADLVAFATISATTADPNALAGFMTNGQHVRIAPSTGPVFVLPTWTSPPFAFAAGDSFKVEFGQSGVVAGSSALKATDTQLAIVRTG